VSQTSIAEAGRPDEFRNFAHDVARREPFGWRNGLPRGKAYRKKITKPRRREPGWTAGCHLFLGLVLPPRIGAQTIADPQALSSWPSLC
jgi:hypothetical protein